MLLIVFGAGASYDSVPHLQPNKSVPEEDRPPLANQLFDNRPNFVEAMERFGDCMDLVPLLRNSTLPIEKVLARLREQADTYPRRFQQLAAIQYYLRYMLFNCQSNWKQKRHRGITNYRTFVDEIERWRSRTNERVCFVTFNYDTMLEEAMQQTIDFKIDELRSYVNRSDYTLIKLHGSVNWGREIDNLGVASVNGAADMIKNVTLLTISDRFRVVNTQHLLREGNVYVFPALTIPVETKDEFACPKDHVATLEDCLDKVTKIITIGWRAMEREFLFLMQKKIVLRPNILVVSGDLNGAQESLLNLSSYVSLHTIAPPVMITDGFSGLIRGSMERLEVFLSE
jgi:hypothetical protein